MITDAEKKIRNREIGARLREVMKMHEIKQEELASYLNKDISTISRYENGEITVSMDLICYLSEHYHVDINYLLMGELPELEVIDLLKGNGEEYYKKQIERIMKYILELAIKDKNE